MKIRKGDTVQVLSGNDKGKTGEVLKVMPKQEKIVVKGVNTRKQGDEGGIVPVEVAIHSSKVNVMCSKCNKPARIGYKIEKDEKVRICKRCGTIIK